MNLRKLVKDLFSIKVIKKEDVKYIPHKSLEQHADDLTLVKNKLDKWNEILISKYKMGQEIDYMNHNETINDSFYVSFLSDRSGVSVVFADLRLKPRYEYIEYDFNNVDNEEITSINGFVTFMPGEIRSEYINKHIGVTYAQYGYEVMHQDKFRATDMIHNHISGGLGSYGRVTTVTEWTKVPAHKTIEFTKCLPPNGVQAEIDTLMKKIEHKIYLNDLFINSYVDKIKL